MICKKQGELLKEAKILKKHSLVPVNRRGEIATIKTSENPR